MVIVCMAFSFVGSFTTDKALADEHFDFTYNNRKSLLSAGWDFLAKKPSGGVRNTEKRMAVKVSYDQVAHPGVLRIPADKGDLSADQNNTRNTLFRHLSPRWMSIRLKLKFAPALNYQQAGLLAYQDDDNYVKVTRLYDNGNKVLFASEVNGFLTNQTYIREEAIDNLYLRLDRDQSSENIAAYYSLDGVQWTYLGSVIQPLSQPRLAVFVGASPGGFPNADLAWAEIITEGQLPKSELTLLPNNLVFNTVQGMGDPLPQIVTILDEGSYVLNWSYSIDVSWLTAFPTSGSTPGDITIAAETEGLEPGVYSGAVTVDAPLAMNAQTVKVTLVVNPDCPVRVSTWKDGYRGAMSISVDDGDPSCFNELTRNGSKGTYFTNGYLPPPYYTSYYQAGMELGSHLLDHVCSGLCDDALQFQEIEPNIQGICSNTPEPCEDVISFAWPCGFTTAEEQAIASESFLSARGYNSNQLEDTTPSNFFNLKSFNSHEHQPYPPDDLKTVVDSAEQEGKWANLVFHSSCTDDGAIDYASGKNVWVAPIASIIKYILQRDRFILTGCEETSDRLTFSFARLPLQFSPLRDFETAFHPEDVITLQVDIEDTLPIASVKLDDKDHTYEIKTREGNKFLLLNTNLDASSKSVEIVYQTAPSPSVDSSGPAPFLMKTRDGPR